MSHRVAFLADVPTEFLRDFVVALQSLYRQSFKDTADLPFDYQRYERPHRLRTDAEIAFLTAARKHGLTADARHNISRDVHAVAITDKHWITLSRTRAPSIPPRRAQFRVDYSFVIQYPLDHPYWEHLPQPIAVQDDSPRQYVILSHGPNPQSWRDLGFLTANFVAPGGRTFMGLGLDMLVQFAAPTADRVDEAVPEPEISWPDEQEQTGGASAI